MSRADTLHGMRAEVHQIAASRVVDDGQRYTSMRRQLVDILSGCDHPITIPDIMRDHPDAGAELGVPQPLRARAGRS